MNNNIRGIVTIEVKDAKTEEVLQTIVKENTLTSGQKSRLIGLSGGTYSAWPSDESSWNISSYGGPMAIEIFPNSFKTLTKEHPGLHLQGTTTRYTTILPNQYGYTGLSWNVDINPAVGELVCRFDAPNSDISFYHLYIGGARVPSQIKAYITLNEPCIQRGPPNSEILDITYRLYWDTETDPTENYNEDIQFKNTHKWHQWRTGSEMAILNNESRIGWRGSRVKMDPNYVGTFSGWDGTRASSRIALSKFPTIDAPASSNTAYNYFDLAAQHDYIFGTATNSNGLLQAAYYYSLNFWKVGWKWSWPRESTQNGSIIQGMLSHPHSYHSILPANNILSDTTNYKLPIQVIHNHNSKAIRPFIDPDYLSDAPGVPTANGALWTNPDFPKMYRIDMGGNSNTALGATYQFAVKDTVGFAYAGGPLAECYWDVGQGGYYDNFGNGVRTLPLSNISQRTTVWNPGDQNYIPHVATPGASGLKAATGSPIWETGINVHNWGNIYAWEMFNYYSPLVRTHFISHNWTGITVTQIMKGWFWNYDTGRDSNMNFEYLTQVVADANNNLWCADRLNGLTRISDILNTAVANNITSAQNSIPAGGANGCYGVCLTANNRIYAVFENGLSYTDNPTNDDPSTIVFNTDSNFTLFPGAARQLIVGLKGDPQHPNNHIAVITANNTYLASTNGGVLDGFAMDLHWYDGSTGETQKCLDQGIPPDGNAADNSGLAYGSLQKYGASQTYPNGRPAYDASQISSVRDSIYTILSGCVLPFNYDGNGSTDQYAGTPFGESNIAISSEHHHQWVNCSQIGSTWIRHRNLKENFVGERRWASSLSVVTCFMNKTYSSGLNIYRPDAGETNNYNYRQGTGIQYMTSRFPMIDAHGVPRYAATYQTPNDPNGSTPPTGASALQSISGICVVYNASTAGGSYPMLGITDTTTFHTYGPAKGPAPPRSGLVIAGNSVHANPGGPHTKTQLVQEQSLPINRDVEVETAWNGKNVGRSMVWRRYGWTGSEWKEGYGQPFADSSGANNAIRIGFDFNNPKFVGDNYVDASSVFPAGGNSDWTIGNPDATFAFKIKRDQIKRAWGNNPQVLFEYFEPNSDNRITLYVDDLVPMYTLSPRDTMGNPTYRRNFWQAWEGNTAIRIHSKTAHAEARIAAATTFNTTDSYRFVLTTTNTSANLFVNGTHIGGISLAQGIDYRNTSGKAKFHIGTNSYNDYNGINLPEFFYHGKIENAQVWSKQWSPSEIANDYADTNGGGLITDTGNHLRAHWLMTETLEDGKPTHFNYQGLEDGITINFPDVVQEGYTGNSWSNGDYYTFGVVEGILNDNAVEFDLLTGFSALPSEKFTTFKNATTGTNVVTAGASERTESLNLVRSTIGGAPGATQKIYLVSTYGENGDLYTGSSNWVGRHQDVALGWVKTTGHLMSLGSNESSSWYTMPAKENTDLELSAIIQGNISWSSGYATFGISASPYGVGYKPFSFNTITHATVDHAISARAYNGTGATEVVISEFGSYIPAASHVGGVRPNWVTGDKLTIKRVSNQVTYLVNDVVTYTSLSPQSGDMYPHMYVHELGFSDATFTYTPQSDYGNIMYMGDPVTKTGYQDEFFVMVPIQDWDKSDAGVPYYAEIYIDGIKANIIANNEFLGWKPAISANDVILDETGHIILHSSTTGKTITGYVTLQYYR